MKAKKTRLNDVRLTFILLLHNVKLSAAKSDTVLPTALHQKHFLGKI